MGSKGSDTTTTSQSADPRAMALYTDTLNRAATAASKPYVAYGGEEVAPINSQQMAGVDNINANAGFAQPYISGAGSMISASGQPISAADIERYQSPYTDQVVDATMADFAHQNAQQQAGVVGNAAAQNALGGDRVAVAQALATEGQNRTQAPVIANLRNAGFQTALQAAQNQQRMGVQAGSQYGQLGISGQQAGLAGAGAQFGAGTAMQTTQQAQDTQARMDYFQQQGYDFQTAQWLAGISTGVGSQMGGNSSTTGPAPNPVTQIAGAGLTAAAMYFSDRRTKENIEKVGKLNDGQTIYRFNYKGDKKTQIGLMHDEVEDTHPEATGTVNGVGMVDYHKATEDAVRRLSGGRVGGFAPPRRNRAQGGYSGPWAGADSWVPTMGIAKGNGPPAPPQLPKQAQQGLNQNQMKGLGNIGSAAENYYYDNFAGGSSSSPLPGLDASDYGEGYYRGGPVRRHFARGGFAIGGSPWNDEDNVLTMGGVGASSPAASFDDRFDAAPLEDSSPRGARDRDELIQARLRQDVINPDEPIRMPNEGATQDWRTRVDQDNGAGQPPSQTGGFGPADSGEPTSAMAFAGNESEPAGVRAINRAAPPRPANDDEGDGSALPYGAKPTAGVGNPIQVAPELQREKSFLEGLGIKMTPSLQQGMLQAGLAMMATRRGGAGSLLGGIGEGAIAGVGAYNQSENLAHREAVEQQKMARDDYWKGMPYKQGTWAQKAADARAKETAEREKVPFGWKVNKDGSISKITGGPQDPDVIKEQTEAKQSGGLSDAGIEVAARQGASGDQSWSKNMGRGAQGGRDITRVRNRMADILINENGKSPQEAAKFVTEANREIAANQIAANAGARTRATRVANLDMILEVADAAVPAALEASQKLWRTGFVPLNKIIEKGRIATSNPEQAEFGIANLQLAEGWARAMNPTGVMRESDRDKALDFLGTATSVDTYERAVKQIQKQIHREKDAISRGHSPKENTKADPGDMPSPKAIELLASDPKKYRDDFEKRYGKGSADRFGG